MAYQLLYKLEFVSNENNLCLLDIYKDYVGDPVDETYLTGSSNPITQRCIDNDNSLYTTVRGQELVAEFVTNTLSIVDFIADEETTFKGIYYVNGDVVFEGFLLQEDSSEEFVDYLHTIRLKFTDGLALLKGVPLTDSSGVKWFSTPTVYSLIKTILLKTGSSLSINFKCNLFPSDVADTTAQCSFTLTKLYTKSFMKNQSDFNDCYSILSDIMKAYGCTLYQYRGEWVVDRWIDRLEQVTQHHLYGIDDFASDLGTSYDFCEIGEVKNIKEVESPLLLSIGRTAKENKITYRFNQWPELIRNLDLDEGNEVVILGTSTQRTYDLDYWTLTSRVAYSRREIDTLGNETERYLFINGNTNNLDLDKYIKPETFPAVKGDKVRIRFSARSKTDLAGTAAIVYVKCGSNYLDDDGSWGTGATFLRLDFASAEDTTQWKSYELESDEIPADGDVELRFLLMQGCTTGNETRYRDISIEYVNIISNSQSAKGDYCNYPNTVTTKNPIDEEVVISDSLRKTNNGALLKTSGALETSWQRGANAETYRFSQLNALGYYQSSYRSKYILEGTFKGTVFGSPVVMPVGFWPVYQFDDLPGKFFTLTSLNEINWFTGVWQGTFVEVHDTTLDASISTVPSGFVYNFIFG